MKLKRGIAFMLALVLSMIILPAKEAKANEDINIISSTKVTKEEGKKWAKSKGATETFINLADIYWNEAKSHGNVNPAIAYAQSALETGYGKFGGVLDESYFNPCGLKNPTGGDDLDPNAHYRFSSWEAGVKGHLDHLALYAGAAGYPRENTEDPRHYPYLHGKNKTVQSLSGSWATDPDYGNKIMRLYNEMNPVVKKPNKMWIDTPMNGETVGEKISIGGWALNDAGVQSVKVYVDGKFIKNLSYGITRKDVNATFPGYPNGDKSGFDGTLDLSSYKAGVHRITVEAIGKDGSKDSSTIELYLNKPQELPNKMWIEIPENNSLLSKEIAIKGWALNSSGVKEVKAYIDGKFIKNLTYGITRNDVDKAMPGYPNGNKSGFEGKIDFTNYKDDYYVLKVEALGNDGTIDKHEIIINRGKKENKMWIELPSSNEVVGNSLNISGWALNDSAVKSVKAYIDGKFIKDLTYGITRKDVDKAMPGYLNGDKSGFQGTIDFKNYKEDVYVLKVEAIGNDGTIDRHEILINKGKKSNKMWIEVPENNSTLSTEITIKGWALNDSGVKSVKLYIDGKFVKDLKYGLTRNDVDGTYPGYLNGDKSGFEGTLNLNSYPTDNYVLKVEVLGNDGSVDKHEILIKNHKLENKMWIDSPENYIIATDEIKVQGWALNPSEVKAVKAYVNGSYLRDLAYGYDRYDVNTAYPGYTNGHKSGFEGTLNLSKYPQGELRLKIEVIGNDGSKDSSERVIQKLTVIDKNLVFDFGEDGPLANNPKMLVLHHAEASNSTVEAIHNFHKNGNGWAGIGYHYYIRKDGSIYKGREESWKGAHASEVNDKSIGVCVEGAYTYEKMAEVQKQAVVKLGKYITKKYDFTDIKRHKDVTATDCPGIFYPFEEIKNAILN